MEELKISNKVLWIARLEVYQMGSHILDMVVNRAWTWPREDSSVHLCFSDMPHAKRTVEVVLKPSQRQPVHSGSNPLPRRMLCCVAPLHHGLGGEEPQLLHCADASLTWLLAPWKNWNARTFISVWYQIIQPLASNATSIPLVLLPFFSAATCSHFSPTPMLMPCCSLAKP